MAKSPALIKNELLVQVGNQLSNIPAAIARAKAALADGIPANEQRGTPAITGAEVSAMLDADVVAYIKSLP